MPRDKDKVRANHKRFCERHPTYYRDRARRRRLLDPEHARMVEREYYRTHRIEYKVKRVLREMKRDNSKLPKHQESAGLGNTDGREDHPRADGDELRS